MAGASSAWRGWPFGRVAAVGLALTCVTGGGVIARTTVRADEVGEKPKSSEGGSALMDAVESVAARSKDPVAARGTLLQRIRYGAACYPSGMTQAEFEDVLMRTQLLPPTLGSAGPRFNVDAQSWVGDLSTGSSGLALRANLTYSFVADGVGWGNSCALPVPAFPANACDLGTKLTTRFGTLDAGREYVRSALAAWRKVVGVTYTEVGDDGSAWDASNATGPNRSATRGDIRIGGYPMGTTGMPLAYNAFPRAGVSTCAGGDMNINTSYFISGYFNNVSSPFGSAAPDALYFLNTVAHEHGHGLGLIHSVPCNQEKLMEPIVGDFLILLSKDEVRGGQRNYGDRFSGNSGFGTAVNLGNLTSTAAIQRDLSTNGTSVWDYFSFTLDSTKSMTITVTPTGQTCAAGTTCAGASTDAACCTGQQSSSCTGVINPVRADIAGNLGLFLYNSSFTQIAMSNSAAAGLPETIATSLGAGTYYVMVLDNGGQPAAHQITQLYDLVVRAAGTLAPPQVIAGLNKRVQAGQTAQFIGNHHSAATEVGATLPAGNYAWDLDGDGAYEVTGANKQRPTTVYSSNGTYPVKLRITDSNAKAGTDTIQVTVFGATTTITSVSSSSLGRGTSGPVIINGTNFKGVTNASQVTVSGAVGEVTVSGTPVVNGYGTQITGLVFTVTGGAALGARNVTITNSDGQGSMGTGTGVITIANAAANDECAAPGAWGNAVGARPFSTTGASTSASQNCASTIPGDVWYSWTAPASGPLSAGLGASATFNVQAAMYAGTTCPPGSALACGTLTIENGESLNVNVTQGQTYLFRIGATPTGQTGSGTLDLFLDAPGACCTGSVCSSVGVFSCGGTFHGPGSTCSPDPCGGTPAERCCFTNGTCQMLTPAACATAGGAAGGTGTTCDPNVCPPPTGTCCRGCTCTITTGAGCTAPSGLFAQFTAGGAACNSGGSLTTPCCFADYNQSGGVTIDDLFLYFDAWFTGNTLADISGNGASTPNIDDLFLFLNVWFTGCP